MINVEDAESIEVGQSYLVNCVRVLYAPPGSGPLSPTIWRAAGAKFVPLLGPRHEDREILKFPHYHWHIHWSFVEQKVYETAVHEAYLRMKGHLRAKDRKLRPVNASPEAWILSFVAVEGVNITSDPPTRLPLTCLRPPAVFAVEVDWLANLERAYLNSRACNNVCPHRGISLVGAPEDPHIHGSRVCMGHGLCFDKQTGALRPRALVNEDFERLFPR